MPELPEVETVARGLAREITGRTISDMTVHWPRTVGCPTVEQFTSQIVGREILNVGRRGKYVVIRLDQGYMLIHLKMSGRLRVSSSNIRPDKHTHTWWDLDDGSRLSFQDTRKFGRVYLVDDPTQITAGLGPEPLSEELTLTDFQDLLQRRSGRLKSLLLNQAFLAGIGNIYADESLFHARLHPLRKADTLDSDDQESLYLAIRSVLSRAIESRGTTLDDQGYVDARGETGSYQSQVSVYGRKGGACPECSAEIERILVGGRSTHFCPQCQI